MSQRIWSDEDDQPYYQLLCDSCRQPFHSYDDSSYDWGLLCAAATVMGWDAAVEPTGPHRCARCQPQQPVPAAA